MRLVADAMAGLANDWMTEQARVTPHAHELAGMLSRMSAKDAQQRAQAPTSAFRGTGEYARAWLGAASRTGPALLGRAT